MLDWTLDLELKMNTIHIHDLCFDREGVTSSSIYRPTRDANMEDADAQYDKLRRGATSKFAPDKGFGGADNGGATAGGASRSAPVQFEKGK